MAVWFSLWLALLSAAVPRAAAQSDADRWSCVEERLEKLGYSTVDTVAERGTLRAERRIGGPLAALKEASAFATGIATLGFVHPPVERKYDELRVSVVQRRARRELRVDAALVVRDNGTRRQAWPRARTVIEALQLTSACDGRL